MADPSFNPRAVMDDEATAPLGRVSPRSYGRRDEEDAALTRHARRYLITLPNP